MNSSDAKKIRYFKSLPSTNTYAAKLAENGCEEFTVVLANEQTEGRGRLGRSFFSPPDSGIYMSVVLRPEFSAEMCTRITPYTAYCVSEAIEKICNIKTEIKWVNDILLNNRKVCGILCEASLSSSSAVPRYVIVGIGINIGHCEFPKELADTAISIDIKGCDIKPLITKKILMLLKEYEKRIKSNDFFETYIERSAFIGEKIYVIKNGVKKAAKALSINENFHLEVRYDNGEKEFLLGGEITIRGNRD